MPQAGGQPWLGVRSHEHISIIGFASGPLLTVRREPMAPILAVRAHNFCAMPGLMRKMVKLDDFDRRLLELVRQNNLEPARTLADKVGLSLSAVLRRLRRLRAEKVIIGDIALIDPALTGSAITMHVLVRMKQPGVRVMDAFARKIAREPEVAAAWEVTGDDDFVLKIQVASMAEYDAFTRRTLDDEHGVMAFKTLITIQTIVADNSAIRPLVAG